MVRLAAYGECTMKNFWKWNTVMFLMQLGMGGMVFAKTGNTHLAVAVAGFAPLLYSIITAPVLEKATGRIVLWTGWISTGALASILVVSRQDTSNAILVVAITSIAWAMLARSQSEMSDEPLWARLICTLPLGIGTIFGGLLILSRKGGQHRAMA